jgi:hypothetical protein
MPNIRIRPIFFADAHDLLIVGFGKAPAMTDNSSTNEAQSKPQRKDLTPAARRALAEAEARRAAAANAAPMPKEFGGPKGPEPTRYGDWENKGIASDF